MNEQYSFLKKDLYIKYLHCAPSLSLTPHLAAFGRSDATHQEIRPPKVVRYAIHYITKGRGCFFADGKTYELSAGDVFILFPGQIVSYKQDSADPWAYMWVEIMGENLKEILERASVTPQFPIIRKTDKRVFGEFAEIIKTASAEEDPLCLDVISHITAILHYFILQANLPENRKLTAKEEQIQRITKYIGEHFSEPDLTSELLAKTFYLSPQYMTRIFRESHGITPKQYIKDMRLKKACELLETGKFSIARIAEAVGYNSQFHFSREFKKYFDYAPTRFVKVDTINQ